MSVLNIFQDWKEVETRPAGTTIFSETGQADVLYVILAGDVEISLHGQVLSTETKGSIIGEMAVIASASGSQTVTAISEVKLARLDREQFNHLIATDPSFAHYALAAMANRLRVVNAFISAQLEFGE